MGGEEENQQTQSIDFQVDIEEEVQPSSWGRLDSLNEEINDIVLVKDKYTCGRHPSCDIIISGPTVSNRHFTIIAGEQDTDTKFGRTAVIEDTSTNGTHLNNKKIGKGKKVFLSNNAIIGIQFDANNGVKKMYQFRNLTVKKKQTENPIAPFEFTDTLLGSGSFADVKLAIHKDSGYRVAVKCISKRKLALQGRSSTQSSTSGDAERELLREVEILKAVDHPCIIDIVDVFETREMLYIVLELVTGGALFEHVVENGKLTENECRLFFYQMLKAMKYLHSKDISHRDLKPENILLDKRKNGDTIFKITDFGLAKIVGEASFMQTLCGTPGYTAPEVLYGKGEIQYTNIVDCWSLGVILYICLVGYPPFSDEAHLRTEQVSTANIYYNAEDWVGISPNALDLIKKLLRVNVTERYTVDQALNHIWMTDDFTITKGEKLIRDANKNKLETRESSMLPPKTQQKVEYEKENGKENVQENGKEENTTIPKRSAKEVEQPYIKTASSSPACKKIKEENS